MFLDSAPSECLKFCVLGCKFLGLGVLGFRVYGLGGLRGLRIVSIYTVVL